MDLALEQEAAQNSALGALLITHFCLEYFNTKNQTSGPSLPKTLLILPLLYHRQTVNSLRRMQRQSGLLKALADNPSIHVGLQSRLQSLTSRTFKSILIACNSKLLRLHHEGDWPTLTPFPHTINSLKHLSPASTELRDMQKAASRLGWWLPSTESINLYALLRLSL